MYKEFFRIYECDWKVTVNVDPNRLEAGGIFFEKEESERNKKMAPVKGPKADMRG